MLYVQNCIGYTEEYAKQKGKTTLENIMTITISEFSHHDAGGFYLDWPDK